MHCISLLKGNSAEIVAILDLLQLGSGTCSQGFVIFWLPGKLSENILQNLRNKLPAQTLRCLTQSIIALQGVFERLARGIKAVGDSVKAESGKDFQISPKFGYVHSCPTNLGTGTYASQVQSGPSGCTLPFVDSSVTV